MLWNSNGTQLYGNYANKMVVDEEEHRSSPSHRRSTPIRQPHWGIMTPLLTHPPRIPSIQKDNKELTPSHGHYNANAPTIGSVQNLKQAAGRPCNGYHWAGDLQYISHFSTDIFGHRGAAALHDHEDTGRRKIPIISCQQMMLRGSACNTDPSERYKETQLFTPCFMANNARHRAVFIPLAREGQKAHAVKVYFQASILRSSYQACSGRGTESRPVIIRTFRQQKVRWPLKNFHHQQEFGRRYPNGDIRYFQTQVG